MSRFIAYSLLNELGAFLRFSFTQPTSYWPYSECSFSLTSGQEMSDPIGGLIVLVFRLICACPAGKHVARIVGALLHSRPQKPRSFWSSASFHYFFLTNQNRTCKESRSLHRACALRNEDSRNEMVELSRHSLPFSGSLLTFLMSCLSVFSYNRIDVSICIGYLNLKSGECSKILNEAQLVK